MYLSRDLLLLLFNKINDFKIQNALSFLTSSKKFDQNDDDLIRYFTFTFRKIFLNISFEIVRSDHPATSTS